MKVDELGAREEVIDQLKKRGIDELFPPQEKAFKAGVLEGKSLLLVAGTGAGKTLVAEVTAVNRILEEGIKAVYMVPLKALANEKYEEFKAWKRLGVRIALTTGDYDSADPWLDRYDLIITSYEKYDSLLRHEAEWIRDVGLLVVDEIHYMSSIARGLAIESAVSEMKFISNPQLIALSATIGNPKEVAEWLGAELVFDPWRPVPLVRGMIVKDGKRLRLVTEDGRRYSLNVSDIDSLVAGLIGQGTQVIVFRATRKMTETTAKRIAKMVGKVAEKDDMEDLMNRFELSRIPRYEKALLRPLIRHGVTFHHAGLHPATKKFIEDAFREGRIRCIVATSTLGSGLNMPSKYVIIHDLVRPDGRSKKPMSKIEVEQFLGRAGRPRYDKVGFGLIYSKDLPPDLVARYYLSRGVENLSSSLDRHAYSFVLGKLVVRRTFNELLQILENTFFAYLHRGIDLKPFLGSILNTLIRYGLAEDSGGEYVATRLGRRISQLYIQPSTASLMLQIIRKGIRDPAVIFYLLAVSEDGRVAYPREFDVKIPDEFVGMLAQVYGGRGSVILDSSAYYTAMILLNWISELDEEMVMQKFKVASGDLMAVIDTSEWLTYSLMELAKVVGSKLAGYYERLYYRTKYGVSDELTDLVKLGINRKRARELYVLGIRTPSDLALADADELAKKLRLSRRTVIGYVRRAKKEATGFPNT
ncbi:MAG: ATP-dependent DNA helicase [Thermoprotei archaeon]|nr:MAG: ATP-dependent DNA helicase [Thermoprotei archaeon]